MASTLIGLDAGTTGVTAILFDRALRPLARAYREFPQRFPRPGWVEHEAADVLGAVDRVLAEVLAHPAAGEVEALGVANQRETVFACERASGRALRPGIVWQDRRTAARCAELARAGHGALVRRASGLVLDPYFSATKIEWMLREDPALARRARAGEVVFATVDALVTRHLCGTGPFATDLTNASRTLLFDIDERRWSEELCALFDVDPAWLPEVRPSKASFGASDPARTAGRRLALHGVLGDQQSALFGQGCFAPGTLKATYGTGSFVVLNTGARRVDSRGGLLTTLAVDGLGEPCYAVEGSVFVSGALVQWLRDELRFFDRSEAIEPLAASVEDSGGVVVVPAFAGLGAPHWDPDARGAILGLSRGSTRAHVARAALEGIAFQVAELIELLREESGLPVLELLADGGAAQNDLLLQIQADLAGLRVARPSSVEATARGAALVAGLGAGALQDAARTLGSDPARETFSPRLPEAERAARMVGWREAVQRVRSAPRT